MCGGISRLVYTNSHIRLAGVQDSKQSMTFLRVKVVCFEALSFGSIQVVLKLKPSFLHPVYLPLNSMNN